MSSTATALNRSAVNRSAVIVDSVRTPLGRRNGSLAGWHPVDLAAHTLRALVERNDLDPALVEDVIMGCVMQVGDQSVNVGRNAALAAGFPESVPGTTIDRQCGSSQQAAHFAAQGVIAGAYDIVIAAGVESMTRVPMGSSFLPGSTPFGPEGAGALRPGAAGHLGGDDRGEVGHRPRRERRLLARVAPACRARDRGGPLRAPDRAGAGGRRRPVRDDDGPTRASEPTRRSSGSPSSSPRSSPTA